jgi:hypothetical protein
MSGQLSSPGHIPTLIHQHLPVLLSYSDEELVDRHGSVYSDLATKELSPVSVLSLSNPDHPCIFGYQLTVFISCSFIALGACSDSRAVRPDSSQQLRRQLATQ